MSYIFYLLFGGRGRVRTGRRGKTVKFALCIYMYILLEEGAEREPAGGEDGDNLIISTYVCVYITWRKGPSENR